MVTRVVKLPDVGEGVAEAEIVEWHVKVGDEVVEDQVLAAVMTDKATVEIPSPASGRVTECGGEIGTILAVGAQLVAIEVEEGTADARQHRVDQPADEPRPAAPSSRQEPNPPASVVAKDKVERTRLTPAEPLPVEKPVASPAVRRRALELRIGLRQVAGSGPAGLIMHQDLDAFLDAPKWVKTTGPRQRTGTEEIKVVGLRRKIAEKMAEATRRIAHFSYVEEVDVTALEDLRGHLNARFAGSRQKLTVLPFIVKAVVVAIEEFPQMNALYDDEREIITRYAGIHAGIATQTPSGLMVPVVRHAEAYDPWGCAAEISRLAQAARDGSAKREDLSGSTISITSLGDLGGIATTPVINRPELAIIGVNRIAIRPVWQDNQFLPRKMMNLSSSFDHRVIDGHEAALFIRRIKDLLERPATIFIES